MKRWIVSLALLQVVGLLCFGAPSAKTARLDKQVSDVELTKKFNAILDEALKSDDVCVTTSAARKLHDLMANSAANIVREKAFARVPEAEKNIRVFAKALVAAGIKESDFTKITPDTIDGLMKRQSTGPIDPPDSQGGGGEGGSKGSGKGLGEILCPLFPIC